MRAVVWLMTGLVVGATVYHAAFGPIPENMPGVLVGYLLSVAGLAIVGVLEDARK